MLHRERMRQKTRETERFYFLVHSPDGSKDWVFARLKPEARTFIEDFHVDGRDAGPWGILCCIWLISKELEQKNQTPHKMPALEEVA